MAYSLVSTAVDKLNSILQDEVALLVGVTDEIEKLSSTFTLIQAVLKDAETRQLKDKAVKIWLEKVKDVAYDVDDILDEWMTDDLRSPAADEGDGSCFSKKRLRRFLSPVNCFNHVKLRHKIGSKIKEVRGRLDNVAKEKSQLSLTVGLDAEVSSGMIRERETSFLLDRSSIVGREDDKNEVVDFLLSGGEANEVSMVISIVGMGGVGKTTLAQLAYNDEDVKGHFTKRMWVCVSEDFDMKRITKSIIESATGTGCESLDLATLQDRLCGMLDAKRFLLVLDDVWSNDSEMWDKLRLPFQAGAPGSRIIVTTRREDVAQTVGSTRMHKLAVLSNDDCWFLFSHRALEHQSVEDHSELEEIGREIVKKCGGFPLAAKTIGSAMRSRRTKSQWKLVLESEIWNSGDVFGGILPALLLSYHDLPYALKQCFSYCSVYPKDWWIRKDEIVKQWVAQGFIRSEGSTDMEEISKLYFDDLLRRSLLQDAVTGSDGMTDWCKMHDLVHDLAQSVAGSDCSTVDIKRQASLKLYNVRHSFLIVSDEAGDEVASIWGTFYKAHKLRTLLLKSRIFRLPLPLDRTPTDIKILRVPHDLFHHLNRLRTLKLSGTSIKELPGTVGQLKHLRHLDLSYTGIEELPEELSNCINLQALILNHCYELIKLPRGMRKLISLRLLEFDNYNHLRYLPQGIGRLTALRKLTKFIVGDGDEGCKCGELKHLNHLQGKLKITGLGNVRISDEAREAELDKKQDIHALHLSYRGEGGELNDDEVKRMDDVLQSLQPHTNLKELRIRSYQGSKLPTWLEDPVFSNLVTVKLQFCYKCEQLPGLGKLPSLKYLEIDGMEEVMCVSGEFTGDNNNGGGGGGGGGGVLFPKLETLYFKRMPNWEEWELRGGDGRVLPSLLQLEIRNRRKLKALHCNLLPLLWKLTLEGINDRMLWGGPLPVLPNLNHLVIGWINDLTSLPGGWLGQLKALQALEISYCPQLESLPEELGQLEALQTLEIKWCPQLGSLPEELQRLTMLQNLYIIGCPVLEERC
ncbi:putative disease resistance protein RGA3 [Magnolia sinica]|uniref:putative disease resistance protein RGA3 n=1 Tax=Magnolia sinica TaxID=86752 RepID=UPI00265972A3|nr:putative disease resistance protein RGA3 [Magnolia sinica]